MPRPKTALLLCAALVMSAGRLAAGDLSPMDRMWEDRCAVCHNINPPPSMAPLVSDITAVYAGKYPRKDDFVEHMSAYLREPTAQKALMSPQVIDQFGLMPPQLYPDEELKLIAGWLWDKNRVVIVGREN